MMLLRNIIFCYTCCFAVLLLPTTYGSTAAPAGLLYVYIEGLSRDLAKYQVPGFYMIHHYARVKMMLLRSIIFCTLAILLF